MQQRGAPHHPQLPKELLDEIKATMEACKTSAEKVCPKPHNPMTGPHHTEGADQQQPEDMPPQGPPSRRLRAHHGKPAHDNQRPSGPHGPHGGRPHGPKGPGHLITCLREHKTDLDAKCVAALDKIPANFPPTPAAMLKFACKADAKANCADSDNVLTCLAADVSKLDSKCAMVLGHYAHEEAEHAAAIAASTADASATDAGDNEPAEPAEPVEQEGEDMSPPSAQQLTTIIESLPAVSYRALMDADDSGVTEDMITPPQEQQQPEGMMPEQGEQGPEEMMRGGRGGHGGPSGHGGAHQRGGRGGHMGFHRRPSPLVIGVGAVALIVVVVGTVFAVRRCRARRARPANVSQSGEEVQFTQLAEAVAVPPVMSAQPNSKVLGTAINYA